MTNFDPSTHGRYDVSAARRAVGDEVKEIEERVLCAMCAHSGPLGIEHKAISKTLRVHITTVSSAAAALERKGYCLRERLGIRVYWHPTPAGRSLAQKILAARVEPPK